MNLFSIHYSGDNALMLSFEQKISPEVNAQVISIKEAIINAQLQNKICGVLELVPSYCGLLVYYNPLLISPILLCEFLETLQNLEVQTKTKEQVVVKIPTCYEKPFCLDLDFVASNAGLTPKEVIELHSEPMYFVYMLGFVAGFPYLGGLNEKLTTPRLKSPRPKIEAGSVGIADKQTGIYPIESPGGWQIIGRTPLVLFNPKNNPPTLLRSGIYLKFEAISASKFEELQEQSIGVRP